MPLKLDVLGPGFHAVRTVAVGFVEVRTQGVRGSDAGVGESPSLEVWVEVVEARSRCSQAVVEVVEGSECRQVRAKSLAQEHQETVVVLRVSRLVGDQKRPAHHMW